MKPLMSSLVSPLVFSTALLLGACGGPDAEPKAPAAAQAPQPDASTQPVPLHPLPVPPGEVRPPTPASEPGPGAD